MPSSESLETTNSEQGQRLRQIASWTHLLGFLLIGTGVVVLGALAQHAPTGGGGATSSQLASHSKAIPIYLTAIFMDWALLYYCWGGVHHGGGNLRTLSGGRWNSWKSIAVDMGIALPFWMLWEGSAYGVRWLLSGLPGAGSAKTVYCRKACLRSLSGWELPSPRAFAKRWPFAAICSGSSKH